MPKCPKCGCEIDHLIYYVKEYNTYEFRIDSKGYKSYTYIDTYDKEDEEYLCPECEETIATTEEEAEEILSKP